MGTASGIMEVVDVAVLEREAVRRAERREIAAGHGARAAFLAVKDAEARARGDLLGIADAAELLHLQAGLDEKTARLGAKWAQSGPLPEREAHHYSSALSFKQIPPKSRDERRARDRVLEPLRLMSTFPGPGKRVWENLGPGDFL
jgi:hypothetical protein